MTTNDSPAGDATTDATATVTTASTLRLAMVTIDCDDAQKLADFWTRMLDGTKTEHGADYAMVEAEGATLGFGRVDDYVRPSWPDDGHKEFHLDLAVDDLEAATQQAIALGARRAEPQPTEADGKWVVLLDPAGHPFCLAVWG